MMDGEQDWQKIQADNNSVAVGSVSVGGSVDGSLIIGSHNVVGFTSDQVSTLIAQISTTFQPKPFDGRSPYKGLDVFEEEDAELFFGREKLVDDLVVRVRESRTLFVTGPSGSGKSSLVRAGLIHALKQGASQELTSDRWLYATMKPGRDPIEALASAFSRLKDPGLGKYLRENASQASALHECAESVLTERKDQRLVLFIDQFEEVFTQLGKDKAEKFIQLLDCAASIENGRTILLFAMRSDFIANCVVYPKLNALLNRQFVQIGAMQGDELVSAIAQPALRVGLRIDPDLIAQIINDMQGEPGALPLMQFALKDLFDAQQAKGGLIALTLKDYLERGGIRKALERHADNSFNRLNGHERKLTRAIFSSLIEIGRGTVDTRRTAVFDELVPASAGSAEVEAIVRKLADARLLTTDEIGGKDTVTISHEKLIDAWPWLKRLVDENRDVIAAQNEITKDAKEWDDHGRDPSYLYSGARLGIVEEQLAASKMVLSGLARDFLEEGIALREAERKAKESLRRRIISGLVAGIAIALVLAGFAVYQMLQAQKQTTISRSQVLAVNAQVNKEKVLHNLLLGIESFNLVKEYPYRDRTIAQQTLRDSLNQVGGIPLTAHDGLVTSLAFSPNGEWLATGGDTTARLWDLKDPSDKPVLLSGHEDTITTLAFSPNGEWLATGGETTARLWDLKDDFAKPIVLRGYEGPFYYPTLAFSPNSQWLATPVDTTARLWDLKDPSAEPIVLRGHQSPVTTLAFSPDNELLATGSVDSTVRLWNLKDPNAEPIILSWHESSFQISTLAFSPNGEWLATGGGDNTAHLWDLKDPSADPIVLSGHELYISTLAFSPNGEWLATGSDDTTVRLWDLKDPSAEPIVLRGHEGPIATLAFSPNGQWLATRGYDAIARLWDLKAHSAEPIILRGYAGSIWGLAFSPDSQRLATGIYDNTASLWDLKDSSAEPIALRGHTGSFWFPAFALSPTGQWLATGGSDNTGSLWDLNDPSAEPIVLSGHTGAIHNVAFSPKSEWLATGSEDNTARLWDLNDLSADPIVLSGHTGAITTLAFSANGEWLATGSEDNTARLWDLKDPSADPIVLSGLGVIYTLAFSPDGKWLVMGVENTVRLWDLKDSPAEPIVLSGHKGYSTILAFSPDGERLASGNTDFTASLWDLNDLSADPIVLRGHTGVIYSLAFSPDGERLATGSEDNTARLWDLKDPPADSIVLSGHTDFVTTLAFSPNGEWLATGSRDATVRLWNLNPNYWVQKACQVVGRNFTRIEWKKYFPGKEYRKTCEQWSLESEPVATQTVTP